MASFNFRCLGCKTGRNDHEFVPTHSGNVVILPTVLTQRVGECAQHLVSFKVSEAVIDLFEVVKVANQYANRR
jgi:hypothetical protein